MREILILTYHSVSQIIADPVLQVSPDEFRRQLDFILNHRIRIVSLREACLALLSSDGAPQRHRSIALTFDDGFQDFNEYALPILHEFGILCPAIFVCPGHVGQTNEWNFRRKFVCRHMDVATLQELQRKHIDIGAHGFAHRNFHQFTSKELAQSLDKSLSWFESNLNVRPDLLAYPYGDILPQQLEVVASRFKYGFTIGAEPKRPDRLLIPRICVTPETFTSNPWWVDERLK